MSLDSAKDPQVSAIVALLKGGVNADLMESLGEQAIVGVYTFPMRIDIVPHMQMPAIFVHRAGPDRWREHTMRKVHRVSTVAIDYVAQPCNAQRLNDRWPLLEVVLNKIVELVRKGKHPQVSGGDDLFDAAGFVDFPAYSTMRAQQRFIPNANDTFPVLQFQMAIEHREGVDISDLPDAIDLEATYNLTGEGEDPYPIVKDITPKDARE